MSAKAKNRGTSGSKTPEHHPFNSIDQQLIAESDSFRVMQNIAFPRPLLSWGKLAKQAYDAIQNSGQLSTFFDFEAPLPRDTSKTLHHIHLGVDISRAQGQITYCLAIGHQPEGQRRILRKVHFDIETDTSHEPKPMSHMQIDGGFPPGLVRHGYKAGDYETQVTAIEKPRIPCHPPAFALLAHWALLEYQSTEPDIQAFIASDPKWIRCVIDAENAVLGKYFQHFTEKQAMREQTKTSFLTACYR